MLLLMKNGGITEQKESKLHIPHSTSNTCSTIGFMLFNSNVLTTGPYYLFTQYVLSLGLKSSLLLLH